MAFATFRCNAMTVAFRGKADCRVWFARANLCVHALSVMGPMRSSHPVIVTPPSSRLCPWSALRPPHYAVTVSLSALEAARRGYGVPLGRTPLFDVGNLVERLLVDSRSTRAGAGASRCAYTATATRSASLRRNSPPLGAVLDAIAKDQHHHRKLEAA